MIKSLRSGVISRISAMAFVMFSPLRVGDYLIITGQYSSHAVPYDEAIMSGSKTAVLPFFSQRVLHISRQRVEERESIILFIYNGRYYQWFVNHRTNTDDNFNMDEENGSGLKE